MGNFCLARASEGERERDEGGKKWSRQQRIQSQCDQNGQQMNEGERKKMEQTKSDNRFKWKRAPTHTHTKCML